MSEKLELCQGLSKNISIYIRLRIPVNHILFYSFNYLEIAATRRSQSVVVFSGYFGFPTKNGWNSHI